MNKIYNVWILIISFITLPIAFFAGINQVYGAWDIILDKYEYIDLVFAIAAGLIFISGAHRASKKWMGIRIVGQKDRYIYNVPIPKIRLKRVMLYNLLEILYFLVLAILFAIFSVKAAIISLVFFIFIIDALINTTLGVAGKRYRIGMTSKAIVSVDREVIAIYFKGLRKVSTQNGLLIFEYVNDLVLDLPIENIPAEDFQNFIQTLKQQVGTKDVYFSGL